MPFVFALVASTLIHAAALLGPGWELPGVNDADPPPTIDAVLARPAARPQPAPVAQPEPRPHVAKPRLPRVVAAAPEAAAPASSPPAVAPDMAPAETPPVAVPSAPTIEPPLAPAAPARSALPDKGRVRYTITRGEDGFVIGQSVHTWQHDGFTYKLQSVTETTGLAALFKPARVVQSSQGEVTTDGLKPREFRHERVGGLDTANFDWARNVVAYAGREDSIAVGAQDFLSMYYQLVLLAPKSGALDMPIATGRKLESYRFEVLGEEAVTLAAGERRALRLKTRSGNDTIELWLGVGNGADRRGLPLKIRFTDRKGEIFDQIADETDIQETQ
ncbi:MAG: DUF3108 domain-containing protein [Sulfuritalea sp.]|jgi:hypothetical protein|nr:DUF3108 domain-containing protein [Sulfuritalea sp.]